MIPCLPWLVTAENRITGVSLRKQYIGCNFGAYHFAAFRCRNFRFLPVLYRELHRCSRELDRAFVSEYALDNGGELRKQEVDD
jgi:hypothetical protein